MNKGCDIDEWVVVFWSGAVRALETLVSVFKAVKFVFLSFNRVFMRLEV